MPEARSDRPTPAPDATSTNRGLWLGALGSLALHALIVVVIAWAPPLPDVDFELVLPSEVDFGVPEGAATPEPLPPAPTPPLPAEPSAPSAPPKPKEPSAQPRDAAVPDPPADAGRDASDEASPDAAIERPREAPKPPPALLSAFAPKGSQISIRLDIAQVRASPLSEDVRLLLLDAPDFRAVIEGSGIDAVRDLDRLYLASPDLRRANVVIAGQHGSHTELAKRAVAALATQAGKPARFKPRDGAEVAPWHDRDETERVLALFANNQFVITANKDLSRVLSVARALEGARALPNDDPQSALLALEPGVMATLVVFDARRFARGNLRGVPTHLEVKARLQPDGGVGIELRGELEDEAAASDAAEYWTRTRQRFASHPLVALIGMRSPLVAAKIGAEGRALVVEGTLTQQQARTLLGFARSAIAPPPPPPPLPAPATAPQSPPLPAAPVAPAVPAAPR
jgi:hypothetical protein